MRVTVDVVVTYHGGNGDGVDVFGSEREAERCVMEYAREYWDAVEFGPFPENYDELYEAWDDRGLWGSFDSRWELESREVEIPDPASPTGAST